jgi:hypothetical protein
VHGDVPHEQERAPESKSWLLNPWLRHIAAQSASLFGTTGGAPFVAHEHWAPPGFTVGR